MNSISLINIYKENENNENDKFKNIKLAQNNISKLVNDMQILYSEPCSPI